MRIALADLARLPDTAEWQELAATASEANPFFEHWFLKPALTFLRADNPIRIAEYRSAGQLCGIFPLSVRERYGRSPVRNTGNWAHYQCFSGAPLIRKGFEHSFWRSLFRALDEVDWSGDLMSFAGLVPGGPVHSGLISASAEMKRPAAMVHHFERALLQSEKSADDYLQAHVRGKKRKEWRRLSHRLAEMGKISFDRLDRKSDLISWCDQFLALEAAGWKGERGAAMANTPETRAFFLDMAAGAYTEGKLEIERLTLDSKPIAMLINLLTLPGSWSFKIAHDESLARFSPGVMIELKNLERVLGDPAIDWMDSCAVENHPMIDRIWAERRTIVQVSVPLSGLKRRAVFAACRAAESGSATLRKVIGR